MCHRNHTPTITSFFIVVGLIDRENKNIVAVSIISQRRKVIEILSREMKLVILHNQYHDINGQLILEAKRSTALILTQLFRNIPPEKLIHMNCVSYMCIYATSMSIILNFIKCGF